MFPCTGCGLCCQNISEIDELKEFDLGNGTCKYLDIKNGFCEIYETRPKICRIDEMYEMKYKKNFTKKEFYLENAKVCNFLQEQYNIDISFRIILGE